MASGMPIAVRWLVCPGSTQRSAFTLAHDMRTPEVSNALATLTPHLQSALGSSPGTRQ
jgi:hypothetical protein